MLNKFLNGVVVTAVSLASFALLFWLSYYIVTWSALHVPATVVETEYESTRSGFGYHFDIAETKSDLDRDGFAETAVVEATGHGCIQFKMQAELDPAGDTFRSLRLECFNAKGTPLLAMSFVPTEGKSEAAFTWENSYRSSAAGDKMFTVSDKELRQILDEATDRR